jgi:hypothetical protein
MKPDADDKTVLRLSQVVVVLSAAGSVLLAISLP